MDNYIQQGNVMPLTAPYDCAAGAGALIGALFGVAVDAVLSGEEGQFATVGVYTLPKATGAITLGANVYWNNTNKNVTTTASGNTLIGQAATAQGSSDATVDVRLSV